MRSIENPLATAALGLALLAGASVHAADVNIGINIGPPPPPAFVVQAPPRLVVVPEVPGVQYAPDLSFNYFAYGGHYYTFNNGAWFVAAAPGAPWGYVPLERVPGPLRGVPVRYYRVPPGHGPHAWDHHDGDRHHHDHGDDGHDHHHDHDHPG